MAYLHRFYSGAIGLGILLGVILFSSGSMVSDAATPIYSDCAVVGQFDGQGTAPDASQVVSARQEIATFSVLSTTLSPKVFLSTVFQNYSSTIISPTIFLPIAFRNYKPPLPPLCRYGVAAWGQQLKWLPTWRAGWTLDFSAHAQPAGVSAEFVQVIRVRQKKDGCTYLEGYSTTPSLTEAGLGAIIRQAPGAIWLVGNEPDRGPNPENCLGPVQDDTYPEMYARAYHDVYHFIKQRDPSARIAIAGLVQVTPGRLQYLDKAWLEYQRLYGAMMPVDIWNMHLYILPEALSDGSPNGIANVALGTDPALAIRESDGDPGRCSDPQVYCFAEHDDMTVFAEQVVAMRTWMKEHGQQNKPLILSEYSLLYPYEVDEAGCFLQDELGNCFTPERVNAFMLRSFEYLETAADPNLGYPIDRNRLVQRWLWFAAYHAGAGSASNLLNANADSLTRMGEQFGSAVETRQATTNLKPSTAGSYPGYIGSSGGTATAAIHVDIVNNGSIDSQVPFTTIFYADSLLSRPIGSAIITNTLPGCGLGPIRVSVNWSGLPTGTHPFWVKIDSGAAVFEEDESDNVATGTVTVYRYGTYLPIMFR